MIWAAVACAEVLDAHGSPAPEAPENATRLPHNFGLQTVAALCNRRVEHCRDPHRPDAPAITLSRDEFPTPLEGLLDDDLLAAIR